MAQLKQQREDALREGYARKIQTLFRRKKLKERLKTLIMVGSQPLYSAYPSETNYIDPRVTD